MTSRTLLLTVALAAAALSGLACKDDPAAGPPAAAEPASYRPDPDRPRPLSLDERRSQYLHDVRQQPIPRWEAVDGRIVFPDKYPDPGKHTWNHLFALLESDPSGKTPLPGAPDFTVQDMVDALVAYPNMFHFNADGPAACLMKYPHLISPASRDFLFQGHDKAILRREEQTNYNLFTGEGTENHICMSRFSGYLFCQNWLKDHPDDERARQGLRDAKEFIIAFARRVYAGETGEFNTSTYRGYHMRGIFTAFDHAEDPEVREACRALLDFFAAELAVRYVAGINAGAECRGTPAVSVEKDCDQFVWLWFGGSPVQPWQASNLVYAAMSSYRPPEILARVARKEIALPATCYNTYPTYLIDQPGFARETLHLGRSFAVSSLIYPAAGFTGACVQFVPAKVVARGTGDRTAFAAYVNSSALSTRAHGLSPWDQRAQADNVLIHMTRVHPEASRLKAAADAVTEQWARDFQASYAARWPKGEQRKVVSKADVATDAVRSTVMFSSPAAAGTQVALDEAAGVAFLACGDTYLAIRSLAGAMPALNETLGLTKQETKLAEKPWQWLTDGPADGALCGFVIEVGEKGDYADFAAFRAAIAANTRLDRSKLASDLQVTYVDARGRTIVARFNPDGAARLFEPIFDWGYILDPQLNHPYPILSKPPFAQPLYPAEGQPMEGWGRVATVTVDGAAPGPAGFADLSKPFPAVWTGPAVQLAGGILTLTDGATTYRVDYSTGRPVWSGQ